MLIHPQFDPDAITTGTLTVFGHVLGPLHVRWYGLMYLLAFMLFLMLGKYRARKQVLEGWLPAHLDDLLFVGALGVVLGGRLGYVLFYKASYYLGHPLEIFHIWEGGMSFHGGFLGVLIALWFYARKSKRSLMEVFDFVAPLVPTGLAAGRLGNFINGELWGRITDPGAFWAMVFPQANSADMALMQQNPDLKAAAVTYADHAGNLVMGLARHPSQLYQFALEGLSLFLILWFFTRKPRPLGAASALFLIGYGSFRFIAEFAREPDDFLGLLAGRLSMGQWLSLPMILAGIAMMVWAYRRKPA